MSKLRFWRKVSQLAFVVLFVYLGLRHQVVGGGPRGAAPIDSYCVFGGVETFFTWVTSGVFLSKTAISNFILFAALLLSILVVGGAFCGWVCPLGAVQEWLGRLSTKIFGHRFRLPPKLDKVLQYLKYPLLIIIIAMTIGQKTLWFETYDPFKVLFHFNFETSTAYIVLVLFLIGSMFIRKFWCKYLCPLGAIITPLSRLSIFKLNRNINSCASCNVCSNSCPSLKTAPGIQGILTDGCSMCLECVDSCQQKNALKLKFRTRWLNTKGSLIVPVGILLVFLLFVGVSMVTGVWNTTMTAGEISYDAQGQIVSDDLKGWMTLNDVAQRYHKETSDLLTGMGWSNSTDVNTPIKDLAKQNGTDMESLRPLLLKLIQ